MRSLVTDSSKLKHLYKQASFHSWILEAIARNLPYLILFTQSWMQTQEAKDEMRSEAHYSRPAEHAKQNVLLCAVNFSDGKLSCVSSSQGSQSFASV